jgi:hypothetical protein
VILLFLSLLVALSGGGANAQSKQNRRGMPSVDEFVERQLKRLDKNGDGKLSKNEADPRMKRLFDLADADGDGFVDKAELTKAAERLFSRLGARRGNRRANLPKPAKANVAYGPHKRNVLDLWRAKSDKPTPLAVFIHGGGFAHGDKTRINRRTLRELLDKGISVAAVNYRFITQAPLPAAHHDCRRALQFLRSKASEWNLDKKRVGAFGGSAGAQLSMYLAFHDEMADPKSKDPIARESTRLTCVATNGGQTTLDFDWWKENVPGYKKLHRDPLKAFDAKTVESYKKQIPDVSALFLISKDDPPIFMAYGMKPDDPAPANVLRAHNWSVHHVIFGIKLQEKTDELGVEADLKYPGAKTKYRSIADFFGKKLKAAAQ